MTTAQAPAPNVLDGLRVLDLAAGTTGSLAAAMLADFGADVVAGCAHDPRTAPGEVGPVSPDWVVAHRGTRLALTDPLSDAGRQHLAQLVSQCHVLVTDDPASLPRLGLTPDTVGGRVVLVMPPYHGGSTPWSGGGESVALLTAMTGLPAYQSSSSGDPVDTVYPYLRYAHAAWAATCALAALLERQHSGRGQVVSVSGLHAANVFCGYLYARPDAVPDAVRSGGSGGLHPVYRPYRGGDGTWFLVGGLGPKFGRAVLELTGSLHLLDDPRIGGRLEKIWTPDNSGWVIAHLEQVFAGRPAHHWLKLLEEAGVPCTELSSREEWFAGDQVAASGQRQELLDPLLGPVVSVGSPVSIGGLLPQARAASPAIPVTDVGWLGPDTWAPDADQRPHARSAGGGPLAGVRVATMGSFVAGPYVGCLLADLGADVIKVEPLEGDPWRLQGFAYNRGARGFAADMRSGAGNEAVHRLLATCDLVLDNFRLGVTARLGISHADLQGGAGTVTVSVTSYGERGPRSSLPGYDTVIQAASGIMTALGGADEPVMTSLPSVDHTAAPLGAFAAVLGLLHRSRSGEAAHISTSLASAALYIQAPELAEFEGRPPGRTGGHDFAGPGPVDRIHAVADGFIRIAATSLDTAAWRSAGLAVDEQLAADDPAAAIAAALAGCTRERALEALGRAGVPAAPVRGPAEIINDPALHEAGVLEWLPPAAGGIRFAAAGRLAAFSRTQERAILATPGLGEHTRELLTEVGYPPAQVEALEAAGQVVCGAPLDLVYLPPYR